MPVFEYLGDNAGVNGTRIGALVAGLLAPFLLATWAQGGGKLDLSRLKHKDGAVVAKSAEGNEVTTTLDPRLQRATGRLVARANPLAAAAVLIDARNGNVLALVERAHAGKSFGSLLLRPSAPSASLFKLVTTAALLERGHVNPKLRVCTRGGQRRIERRHLEAPKLAGTRCNLFFSALGHSRNAVYAQLVTTHLMHRDLAATVDAFGLNAAVPFDVPTRAARVHLPYGDLAFARTAAGFENVRLSPLGAAQLAAVVMTGGRKMRFFVKGNRAKSRTLEGRAISEPVAHTLRRMMEVTVHAGTSLDAFSSADGRSHLGSIRVAGKTGTLKPSARAPTTSWFVGFAPSRKPEVLVSVVMQNGKVWRQKANQIARDMLRVWFARRRAAGVSDPFAAKP